MKKFSIFICAILLLTSCQSVNNSTQEDSIMIKEPEDETNTLNKDIENKKSVIFNTFDVDKKYYNEVEGYAELKLKLVRLEGDYEGIPKINKYFADKEEAFYNELPLDFMKENNIEAKGEEDNYYRSAYYKLEIVLGDIISVSAELNGGAGGVGWAGIEGDTFDLNTGKKLSLEDIFNVNRHDYMNFIYGFVADEIMVKIKSELDSDNGSAYNFDDAYSAEGQKAIRSFDSNDFYLTKEALVVFYPKYALSCGAGGPQKFSIPYDEILDFLSIDI